MKFEKGVTLMSLAIYIVLILITIAILATVTANFQSNVKEINQEGIEVAEINKFNMYFVQEVKKQGNDVSYINTEKTEITFANSNTYYYDDTKDEIYLQKEGETASVKIASNIKKCEFEERIENGKKIIIVTIQAGDLAERVNEYVLISEENSYNYEDEESYVYNVNNTTINEIQNNI